MQTYCDNHSLSFRPHVKTHKTREIAAIQLQSGAQGLTFQKLGEAEALADVGASDTLIAFNLTGHEKLDRLAALARSVNLSVAIDDVRIGEAISATLTDRGTEVGIWVDCDTGLGRTGVQSAADALRLARQITKLPGLSLRGLFTYPTPPPGTWLDDAVAKWEREGLSRLEVSVGGTPGAFETHLLSYPTELRAGAYVFMDLFCVRDGVAAISDCALTVHATCVSRPTPTRAILDAGSKALGLEHVDFGAGAVFGVLRDKPTVVVSAVYEEHATLRTDEPSALPDVGERVEVIPSHCCYTVNLHDTMWLSSGGTIVDRWVIAARGAVA